MRRKQRLTGADWEREMDLEEVEKLLADHYCGSFAITYTR